MDLVEKSGTGYLRIKKALKKYKMPDPLIETNEHWFTITFKRPDLQKMTMRERMELPDGVEKSVEKSVEKIVSLMKDNPNITQSELSEKTGLSRWGVEKNIKILKDKKLIKRVGPDKGGHWEILK
ncbi:winged helix-turn-helix transcriptional regulator [Patescibacteria group bacterium]|nr:winged helix-turn-helix transcriptional regulator [Patescibacteria group bacterium]MBU1933922.1 winged helix-turn-helix transcriptional regulator [Patescibacteria group bacterium]MBU2233338.1 winged helix-turn-helix transcriptional regulator [Patescibacteria group bacterium]MBU2264495.1 winged helix-turn-helix transcriptional regulator [Patescibacteria group bacterium]